MHVGHEHCFGVLVRSTWDLLELQVAYLPFDKCSLECHLLKTHPHLIFLLKQLQPKNLMRFFLSDLNYLYSNRMRKQLIPKISRLQFR